MNKKRLHIILWGVLILIGLGIIAWSNIGEVSITTYTAGVFSMLESNDIEVNEGFRNDLLNSVNKFRWLWAVVQWLGLAVVVTSVLGLFLFSKENEHPIPTDKHPFSSDSP
jgi:hypothetical protein